MREELERSRQSGEIGLPGREIDLDDLSQGGGAEDDGEDVEEDEPEEAEA